MKRKPVRIFFLVILTCIAFTGYIKGCNSAVFPKQYPTSLNREDSLDYISGNLKDSTVKVTAGKHYQKSGFHKLLFGEHYRDLWAQPVEMKVFDIGEDKGGFTVLKKGGSMQTLNLRLESEEGREYVLRSIDKDQSKALPKLFKNKITSLLIRDQTSALNPYGALIIPRLAEAADIMHTNPELVFIAYDPRFGKFAKQFEGRVALLEEYPDETWAGSGKFKDAEKIHSTSDVLSNRFRSQDVYMDEKSFAKARLFDLLINDWDRHVDQWRWAEFSKNDKTVYKPIPRDRDAAFYKFDSGLLPHLVLVFNQKFQSFDNDYGNIKGLVKNAKYLDRLILNSITQEEFIKLAKELQCEITDKVIEEAVASLPEEVYKVIGKETIEKLKARRNTLNKAAQEYYRLLFEEVQVVGTDKKEIFTVERLSDELTAVTVCTSKGERMFHQVYRLHLTKEINLYGLNGADEFILKGKTDDGILINIYGGQGRDEIVDHSHVKGYLKKTRVYDTKGNNDIETEGETEDLSSYDPSLLYFDRTGIRRK